MSSTAETARRRLAEFKAKAKKRHQSGENRTIALSPNEHAIAVLSPRVKSGNDFALFVGLKQCKILEEVGFCCCLPSRLDDVEAYISSGFGMLVRGTCRSFGGV
jgi:hypothetical protein